MFFKKFKASLLLLLFIIPVNILAYSSYLIPGGENVGIKVLANGVIIVGSYSINGKDTLEYSGLNIGDTIVKINNEDVKNIDDMVNVINNSNGKEIYVTFKHNGNISNTTIDIVKEDGIYKTGLYVKDSVTGIGTLSFIDPETKKFGALGHEIIEKNSGNILDINSGFLFKTNVTSIDRSENGIPGSKNASLNMDTKFGEISENTIKGIFGTYTNSLPNKKMYKVASVDDIKLGNAKILTVLNGNEVKEYDINILKLNKNDDTKNILFEITDEELINNTGGIVQGMSGSSIIQGEYIIGAVTHVIVEYPKRGYGIFITNMLEEAEN